jgi:alcohol dehydrogenase class IV
MHRHRLHRRPQRKPVNSIGCRLTAIENAMIEDFVYQGSPVRVLFGSGTISAVAREVQKLNCRAAFVLTAPQQKVQGRAVADALGPAFAGLFCGAVMHTPVHVTEDVSKMLRQSRADCAISLGGGSATGLGKALAIRTGVRHVCIPTTYAGSEMTPILGETEGGGKTTRVDARIAPDVVIYDVDLTLSLPPALSGASGMNAIAHACEAIYARDRSPKTTLLAIEGIRTLATALPDVVANPDNRAARACALYGAWLCGTCLGEVGMALHHKLCHVLGGLFDLPHAETHAIILPHAIAYNAPAIPDAMCAIAGATNTNDAAQGLFSLGQKLGVPRALKDLGMPESGIDKAADAAMQNSYWNPRALELGAIRDLIACAWNGEPPRVAAS